MYILHVRSLSIWYTVAHRVGGSLVYRTYEEVVRVYYSTNKTTRFDIIIRVRDCFNSRVNVKIMPSVRLSMLVKIEIFLVLRIYTIQKYRILINNDSKDKFVTRFSLKFSYMVNTLYISHNENFNKHFTFTFNQDKFNFN